MKLSLLVFAGLCWAIFNEMDFAVLYVQFVAAHDLQGHMIKGGHGPLKDLARACHALPIYVLWATTRETVISGVAARRVGISQPTSIPLDTLCRTSLVVAAALTADAASDLHKTLQ
jgi:hypothetical protein